MVAVGRIAAQTEVGLLLEVDSGVFLGVAEMLRVVTEVVEGPEVRVGVTFGGGVGEEREGGSRGGFTCGFGVSGGGADRGREGFGLVYKVWDVRVTARRYNFLQTRDIEANVVEKAFIPQSTAVLLGRLYVLMADLRRKTIQIKLDRCLLSL